MSAQLGFFLMSLHGAGPAMMSSSLVGTKVKHASPFASLVGRGAINRVMLDGGSDINGSVWTVAITASVAGWFMEMASVSSWNSQGRSSLRAFIMRSESSLVSIRSCVASEHSCFAISTFAMAVSFLCFRAAALWIDLIVSVYCACAWYRAQ